MKQFNIAILGCGTVGGGVARIILDKAEDFKAKYNTEINIKRILDLFPAQAAAKQNIPLELFCGNGKELSKDEAAAFNKEIIEDDSIDLVVETIGGSNPFILNLVLDLLKAKKHVVTANKALLAKHHREIFKTAKENDRVVGFEASVCGAIPIIKGINECFTGDDIECISGIMNGTSNYILSKMDNEGLSFEVALKQAQEQGYAEADPTLDINGGDAGHKLTILLKLVFGVEIDFEELSVNGIENITADDIEFAKEINSVLKLLCYAKKEGDTVYAGVQPVMVKSSNLLSDINNATNAVKLDNRYSGENILIGQGAGSLETGSAIVSDIVFLAQYADKGNKEFIKSDYKLKPLTEHSLAYNIIFETEDVPGITGRITTAIGNQNININTVSHNKHNINDRAVFAIETMPCTYGQIMDALKEIDSSILFKEPKVIPVIY